MKVSALIAVVAFVALVNVAGAQTKPAAPAPSQGAAPKPAAASAAGVRPPSDYVIGIGDVLDIDVRNEKDLTGEYLVRPDRKITLRVFGDVEVVDLTTEQLRERLVTVTSKLIKAPSVTVGVKEINSRKVTITGGVNKPGQYDIIAPMDVVELIGLAGSLKEYANGKNITILRNGVSKPLKFNYKEVLEGKNTEQNIPLKPGDKVLVPE
jgi:polysaccharide biosynthesis/export protein